MGNKMNKSRLINKFQFNVFCGVEDGKTYSLLVSEMRNCGYTQARISEVLHDVEVEACNNKGIKLLG